MKINPVYIVMVLGLLILVPFTRHLQQRPTSFYGIAENQDLDLSLEYPVLVQEIHIKEGQRVSGWRRRHDRVERVHRCAQACYQLS